MLLCNCERCDREIEIQKAVQITTSPPHEYLCINCNIFVTAETKFYERR
jgi:hypothetical protein